ncbi:Uncharacterised protein [Zhongshania aliphaticivorans]|uniref:Uncharacterized protein n=1 Tax=Zhongshania aliphaticivorans TaxID=1470434 RepID=A0A5S9PNJ7_9GAMM|nr:UDP-N-acetylglucosamine--LPS N-acetylglucosamine transferase [Zhongshania aliphaticivorans]CAA0105574.1 Uncharacterised protein [Zhongshania aliphaticivorans]CAA0105860.1 Uncharacterised protein [Zhongshania aliphaticivorans]
MKKIFAVASGGGHWKQLMLLRPAFEGQQTHFVTTMAGLPSQEEGLSSYAIIPDCNRDRPIKALLCVFAIFWQLIKMRPDVIISTGALPGVIALAIGKKLGIKTVWVDSVANAETFSMSGLRARKYADLWLSQWEHVAEAAGAQYMGSVL